MQPQVKESQELLATPGKGRGILSWRLRRDRGPATPRFPTSGLQNSDRTDLCCRQQPSVWSFALTATENQHRYLLCPRLHTPQVADPGNRTWVLRKPDILAPQSWLLETLPPQSILPPREPQSTLRSSWQGLPRDSVSSGYLLKDPQPWAWGIPLVDREEAQRSSSGHSHSPSCSLLSHLDLGFLSLPLGYHMGGQGLGKPKVWRPPLTLWLPPEGPGVWLSPPQLSGSPASALPAAQCVGLPPEACYKPLNLHISPGRQEGKFTTAYPTGSPQAQLCYPGGLRGVRPSGFSQGHVRTSWGE